MPTTNTNMDPERQPLLGQTVQYGMEDVRCRRYRPLTQEEVLSSRQEVTWRRARFFVIVMFWAIMAMFLSCIAFLLIKAQPCDSATPSVAPVHLNFGPLITELKHSDDDAKFELWMP